jgi:hypothetical protein
MTDPNDPVELSKLSDLLADPSQRKLFFLDPDAALSGADIDLEGIPAEFLAALKELDYGELGLLSRINRRLIDGGLGGENLLRWPV